MVNLIPKRGRLLAFDASENVSECCTKAFCTVERYGFAESSTWQCVDMEMGASTSWTMLRNGAEFAQLTLPMAGEHNALNATSGCGAGCRAGSSGGCNCGSAGYLQEREAETGGAR